jgi:hypothetical protein
MTEQDSTPVVSAAKPNSETAKRKPSTPATTPAKKERVKPDKPYKDFPLFPHDGKQWAKKIRGKLHYFGSWDNPMAARDKWLREKDDLLAGRTPRAHDPNAMTVKQLCDLFCESKEGKVATGEITQRTFEDYKISAKEVAKHLGKSAAVEQLRPDDFRKLRSKMVTALADKLEYCTSEDGSKDTSSVEVDEEFERAIELWNANTDMIKKELEKEILGGNASDSSHRSFFTSVKKYSDRRYGKGHLRGGNTGSPRLERE